MTAIRVVNRTRGTELGRSIRLADSLLARLRGFLFHSRPETGEGLLLSPCRAVHMIGVSFPLDVVFIDDGGRVVALYPDLRPLRRTRIHGMASHALELPVGTIESSGTEVGDSLLWSPMDDEAGGIIEMSNRENGAGRETGETRKRA